LRSIRTNSSDLVDAFHISAAADYGRLAQLANADHEPQISRSWLKSRAPLESDRRSGRSMVKARHRRWAPALGDRKPLRRRVRRGSQRNPRFGVFRWPGCHGGWHYYEADCPHHEIGARRPREQPAATTCYRRQLMIEIGICTRVFSRYAGTPDQYLREWGYESSRCRCEDRATRPVQSVIADDLRRRQHTNGVPATCPRLACANPLGSSPSHELIESRGSAPRVRPIPQAGSAGPALGAGEVKYGSDFVRGKRHQSR
jgi:hypothetical protein